MLVWILGVVHAAPDLASEGTDRLGELAELRFTTVGVGEPPRSWVWWPRTAQVRLEGGAEFRLGAPEGEEQRAAERSFLEDTFWLAPQLHARWAGEDAQLTEAGASTLFGEELRTLKLQYRADGGGYSPGDLHELYVEAGGRISAWSYHPGAAAEPVFTVAFRDWVAVGPLELATTRLDAGGRVVRSFRDLGAIPSGTTVAVEGEAPFLRMTPTGCSVGPVSVPVRTAVVRGPGSRTSEVSGRGDFSGRLSVRIDAGPERLLAWSEPALALADAGPLQAAGLLACDFHSLDEPALRRVLAEHPAPRTRAAVLTVLLEWTLSEATLPPGSGPVLHQVWEDARSCAHDGRCEPLYADLGRVR